MSYREGDRITYASVNGQTGKVVADFPISRLRFLLASLLTAALVFLAMNLFLTLKPEWSLAITSLLLIIGVVMCSRQLRKLSARFSGSAGKTQKKGFFLTRRVSVVLTVIALLVSAVILLIDPVYNSVFYGTAVAEAVILFFLIGNTLRAQLQLATRRPPQFSKKGGRDNA